MTSYHARRDIGSLCEVGVTSTSVYPLTSGKRLSSPMLKPPSEKFAVQNWQVDQRSLQIWDRALPPPATGRNYNCLVRSSHRRKATNTHRTRIPRVTSSKLATRLFVNQ